MAKQPNAAQDTLAANDQTPPSALEKKPEETQIDPTAANERHESIQSPAEEPAADQTEDQAKVDGTGEPTAEPSTAIPPENVPVYGAFHAYCNNVEYLRERVTLAILQNPNIERLCYGNPLDKGRRSDYASAGALLAHLCDQLAVDYFDATKQVDAERRRLLGADESEFAMGAGHAVSPES